MNGANVSGQDFTATGSITYRISGTVSGAVASGVTITLSGPPARTTVSDGSGAYSFTGVVNATYGLTPSLPGYTFFPVSHTVVVSGADVSGQDFTATRIPLAPELLGSRSPCTRLCPGHRRFRRLPADDPSRRAATPCGLEESHQGHGDFQSRTVGPGVRPPVVPQR